jgi:hypothetical protein
MSFNIQIDAGQVADALDRKFLAAFARERVVALEKIADGILNNIKREKIFPNEKKGTLKKGLWRGKVKSTKTNASVDLGWSGVGAAFGPGHEFGFKKTKWKVAPVGIRTSTTQTTKRIGKPILALRFVAGGEVAYSRGHEVSAPSKLYPHFVPAAKKYAADKEFSAAVDRAARRAGL